jgi:hypothetical protein
MATAPSYCYGYYWYYAGCWYPSYSYLYNLPTATIVVDMADVANSSGGKLSSVWTALLRGLYETAGTGSGEDRVNDAMTQAFNQSPYLAEGGAQ